eukprot:evm.model.scf_268.2 EVM.evm.TU.scf_268.2   scf_268:51560-57456(+)
MIAANRPPVAGAPGATGRRCCGPPPHALAPSPAARTAAHPLRRARDVHTAADSNGGSLQLSALCETPAAPRAVAVMWERLRGAGVAPVSCHQLLRRQQDGIPVVDVRPKNSYEKGHIPESLNIPLYDLIEGWSPFKIGKRLSFLMFGKIDGTEMQEDFLNVCADMCDPEKGITLVCGVGFTSPENPGDFAGFATRSLIAAHELVANGFKNVRILRNGIAEYEESERLEGGPLCSGCCTIVSSEQFPHVSGEDTATIPAYFQADISFHHLTCPPLTNNSFVYMHCTCNHLPPRVSITSVFWRHTPHHRPFH